VLVGVKRLHAGDSGQLTVKDIERFRAELVLLASLQHENVVTCYGAVVDAPPHANAPASPLAIVMEFVGDTLKRRIAVTRGLAGTLPLADLLSIALGLARGIEFLHKRSIVHRDLKPGNCLLTTTNVPKICDFGVSRSIEDGTAHMTRIGTPAFMAPEILRGDAYSEKCDVYSFAMIVWQMTSGAAPFQTPKKRKDDNEDDEDDKPDAADAFNVILKAAIEHRRPPVDTARVPEALATLIDEMWHQLPHARPSFSTIVTRLDAIARSNAASTAPSSLVGSSTTAPTPSLASAAWDAETKPIR